MTTGTTLADDPPAPDPTVGHLWRITDLAAFLNIGETSAGQTREAEPDTPRPILGVGSIRLWHGEQ